jgi:hypothetical protein
LAGQTVNCAHYWYLTAIVKMCEDFVSNFGDRSTGCCTTTTHRLTLRLSPGNFFTKTTWLSFPTHPNFLFARLRTKQEGHHLDTTVVTEAESQAVLNTLTKHDFQDAFKKMSDAVRTVHTRGRGLLRGWW